MRRIVNTQLLNLITQALEARYTRDNPGEYNRLRSFAITQVSRDKEIDHATASIQVDNLLMHFTKEV